MSRGRVDADGSYMVVSYSSALSASTRSIEPGMGVTFIRKRKALRLVETPNQHFIQGHSNIVHAEALFSRRYRD